MYLVFFEILQIFFVFAFVSTNKTLFIYEQRSQLNEIPDQLKDIILVQKFKEVEENKGIFKL